MVPERWRTQRLSNCRAACWFRYHCRYLCPCHCRSHAADRRPYPPRLSLQKREPVLRSPKPIIEPYAKFHSPSADKIKFTDRRAIAMPMGKTRLFQVAHLLVCFQLDRLGLEFQNDTILALEATGRKPFHALGRIAPKRLHMFMLGITS